MTTGGWIVGLLLATRMLGTAGMVITVEVYNDAQAPQSAIHRALVDAGSILRQAGVGAQWIECGNLAQNAEDRTRCVHRNVPEVISLSVLAADPRGDGNALGFAILTGTRNSAAVVTRVVAMLKDNSQYKGCDLLASVIAHELGHLLLQPAQHSDGLMKANWSASDFEAMRHSRLTFTPAQVRSLNFH